MQKISFIKTLIIGSIAGAVLSVAATALEVSDEEIQKCNTIDDRVQRLSCYENLLGRSVVIPNQGQISSGGSPEMPKGVMQSIAQVQSANRTDTGVAMHLLTGNSFDPWPDAQAPLFDYIKKMDIAKVTDIREKTSLYFALPSNTEIGESAVLTLSCQTNITNFDIYWVKPFDAGISQVTFQAAGLSNNIEFEKKIDARLISKGYQLKMPRGLESIRLINALLKQDVLQVSLLRGNETVSAFFDTSKLTSSIALLARQCSWAGE